MTRCTTLSFLMAMSFAAGLFAGPDTKPADADPIRWEQNRAPNMYGGYSDYPAAEVQAVPQAFAAAAQARAERELSLDMLRRAVDRIRDDFEHSPEYLDALAEEKVAHDAYSQARHRALRKLSSDSGYRALVDMVVDLRDKIEREHPGTKATPEQLEDILAIASVKLGYASNASAMEAAMLTADSDYQNAREKLLKAGAKLEIFRGKFERDIRRNPEFLAARVASDRAKIAKITTAAFLDGAVYARNIALDFAAYLHRWDQYKYSTATYVSNPYPYGYQYNYPGYNRRY